MLFLFLPATVLAQNWTKTGGGKNYDEGISVGVDNKGNVYSLSAFQDTATFGDTIFTDSSSNFDGFALAKYNASGQRQWIQAIKTQSIFIGGRMMVDPIGNIYLSSVFIDSVTIQDTTLYCPYQDFYLAKFNTNGKLLWMQKSNNDSTIGEFSFQMASLGGIDSIGNIYLECWDLQGTIVIGKDTLLGYTGFGFVQIIAKFDSNGNALWARRTNDFGMKIDHSGNYYNTFKNSDTLFYINKYNDAGILLWSQSTTANIFWYTIDGLNNVYARVRDYYQKYSLIKYSKNGYKIWEKKFNYNVDNLASDKYGNVVLISGYLNNIPHFAILHIEKYDSSGTLLGYIYLGNILDTNYSASVMSYTIELDDSGYMYVTGSFNYNGNSGLLFINDTVFGYGDMFLTKFHSSQMDFPTGIVNSFNSIIEIKVFPNPVNNSANLFIDNFQVEDNSKPNNIVLSLFDIMGKQVKIYRFSVLPLTIDCSDLINGMYLYRLSADFMNGQNNIITSGKIIVTNTL